MAFCRGIFLLSFAFLAASKPISQNETGPADFFNLQFTFGNEDSSPNFDFNEIIMKGAFSSERMHTRPDRPGDSVEYHDCDRIQPVPRHLTFITRYNFYRKYTHAYGIPIVSSYTPSDAALKRACYVLRFMLGDRRILRHYLYKYYGRIGIIATTEVTRTIPEHSFLPPWWDQRARGLGGTIAVPISTGAEENILCLPSDRYHAEDIFLHEFSHGIHEIAVRGGGIPGHWDRLSNLYNYAKRTGLWRNTYAMSTPQEYWAEAVQSFFDVNDYANPPNGIHGPINTRPKLRNYDPAIFKLITEVFPCQNHIHDRCKRGTPPPFKMNCDGDHPPTQRPTRPPTTRPPPTTVPPPTTEPPSMKCEDTNQYCQEWAKRGFCRKDGGYVQYMMHHCSTSCQCCKNQYDKCDQWKEKGYCQSAHKYRPWMEKNCHKTCRVCEKIIFSGKNSNVVLQSPPKPINGF